MAKKIFLWSFIILTAGVLTFWFWTSHYILSSVILDDAIKHEIPTGSSKTQVLTFIRARKPVVYDDLGDEVKARFSGLAENRIYHKDIILTFKFDAVGRLLSYNMQEYFTFF